MTVKVKRGDTSDIVWTVNANVSGAALRVLARSQTTREVYELDVTLVEAGVESKVTTSLDGTLPVAVYDVELEITSGAEVATAPTCGFAQLSVTPDLG